MQFHNLKNRVNIMTRFIGLFRSSNRANTEWVLNQWHLTFSSSSSTNHLNFFNYFSVQQCNEVKSITPDHDDVLTSTELKMLPFEAFLAKAY